MPETSRTFASRADITRNFGLCAELKKLSPEERFDLLGQLLEPSIHSPFDHDWDEEDAVTDALAPIADAYRLAYADVRAVLDEADEARRVSA
jgi:hypothetical protein